MVETVPSWSDARVDQMRRLWEEGLSASQIATQLGGVTRNAVIGKLHRLGLSGRAKNADAGGDAASRTAGDMESDFDALATMDRLSAGGRSATRGLAISRRVTIMDLRESMCRWPLGDPTSPDFHYCGDRSITGLPYCTTHAQIAYQPAAERKRDRRVGGFR